MRRVVPPGVDYQSDLSWSADGRWLAYTTSAKDGVPRDVWVVAVDGQSSPRGIVSTASADIHPMISPDGHWVAYTSETSGRREVYLARLPDGTMTRQISFGGGEAPQWSPDGKQIYYVTPAGLVRVEVSPDGVVAGRPTVVYDKPFGQSDPVSRNYTIAPDGRPVIVEPSERRATVDHLSVISPWHALLATSTDVTIRSAAIMLRDSSVSSWKRDIGNSC